MHGFDTNDMPQIAGIEELKRLNLTDGAEQAKGILAAFLAQLAQRGIDPKELGAAVLATAAAASDTLGLPLTQEQKDTFGLDLSMQHDLRTLLAWSDSAHEALDTNSPSFELDHQALHAEYDGKLSELRNRYEARRTRERAAAGVVTPISVAEVQSQLSQTLPTQQVVEDGKFRVPDGATFIEPKNWKTTRN